MSSSAARVSAYASTTHCRSEKLAVSPVWMSGRATLTMVTSSSSMNVPRQTATRVHHLFPVPFEEPAGAASDPRSVLPG